MDTYLKMVSATHAQTHASRALMVYAYRYLALLNAHSVIKQVATVVNQDIT